MRKAVADTNVFVSAVARMGPGAIKVRDAWIAGLFDLITSEAILEEIERTLVKEGASEAEKDKIVFALRRLATLVTPTETITDCRDPDDNKVLEAAVAGNADYIPTRRDKDLRALTPYREIEIVTVRRFLRKLSIKK